MDDSLGFNKVVNGWNRIVPDLARESGTWDYGNVWWREGKDFKVEWGRVSYKWAFQLGLLKSLFNIFLFSLF